MCTVILKVCTVILKKRVLSFCKRIYEGRWQNDFKLRSRDTAETLLPWNMFFFHVKKSKIIFMGSVIDVRKTYMYENLTVSPCTLLLCACAFAKDHRPCSQRQFNNTQYGNRPYSLIKCTYTGCGVLWNKYRVRFRVQ